MKVPFVDLAKQYYSIKEEIDCAIENCVPNSFFIGGKIVKSFEYAFSNYISVRHTVGCANGTDAIEILLKSMGIGPGDEVIVPAISWISTSEAVSSVGAKPIFVDIEPDYYTIDPRQIEKSITKKTKAIIPVHLYGHPADMVEIIKIAQRHDLRVLEDCAQAHGAAINNKKVGLWGDCASFSFYPGKNLGAYGDAGCMITDNDEIAEKARLIANHGQIKKHSHIIEGRNSRLDTIQAGILLVKLKHLDDWTAQRIRNADRYFELLRGIRGLEIPKVKDGFKHVFHLYVIRVGDRDRLLDALKSNDIGVAIHYPHALPFLDCYKRMGHSKEDFPVAYDYQSNILSIPMYPELDGLQLSYVCEKIKECLSCPEV